MTLPVIVVACVAGATALVSSGKAEELTMKLFPCPSVAMQQALRET
ncbi:MAG: hypothetical protein ABSF64_18725 [Bryobacteraceae bacterium]